MILNNKNAIITGASSGLGAAIALALTTKGCTVYGLARNETKLAQIQKQAGMNFHPVKMDVANEKALRNWVQETFTASHIPDILINNAGAGHFGKIDELPSGQWLEMINTNLNAVFFLTSAVVPLMKTTETGKHIINIGSILGKTSGSEKSGYSATKYAMQGYSEALFKELRGYNIKVTLLNPGSIDTHFFESAGIVPNEFMLQPNDIARVVVQVLETPDNVLIDELTIRPLKPMRD